MKTRQELKSEITHKIMELRNKGLIEEDSILDVLDDNLDPYITELEKEREIIKNVMYEFLNCMKEYYYPTEESLKIAKEFVYGKKE